MNKMFTGIVVIVVAVLAMVPAIGSKVSAEEINLIKNPSLEIAGTSGSPQNWTKQYWGSPIPTFKYPDIGREGSKGATVTLSRNSTGDARWSHEPVLVSAGDSYEFSSWYKSNVATEINIEYTNTAGKLSYALVKTVASSSNIWKKESAVIKVPTGMKKMRIYHLLSKRGSLTIDDFSLIKTSSTTPTVPNPPTLTFSASSSLIVLGESTTLTWTSTNATSCVASIGWSGVKPLSGNEVTSPVATTTYALLCSGDGGTVSKEVTIFVKPVIVDPPVIDPPVSWDGMVTFSFDDSWLSQYTVALPILEAAGLKGTFYITTEPIQKFWDGFMTPDQVKDLANRGHEIGGHTVTHRRLTNLSQTDINKEIIDSKIYLENLVGKPVSTLAYPYGAFNTAVKDLTKVAGYHSARGVYYDNLNTEATDKYNLYSRCLEKSTPFAEIQSAIDQAKSNKQWFIICLHEVRTDGDEYSITPTQFQQIVDYVKSSGLKTVTIKEGTALMAN